MAIGDNFRKKGYSEVFIEDAIMSIEEITLNELDYANMPNICPLCNKNDANTFATECPFALDIGNQVDLCFCCDECRKKCLHDI